MWRRLSTSRRGLADTATLASLGGWTFSLNWRAVRVGPLGKVAIWIAILMIVVLIVMNVLRG